MLTINKKSDVKFIHTEVDRYVPITVTFSDKQLSDLYWRVGNGVTSLLEIGLLKSGIINSITITCFDISNVNMKSPILKDITNVELAFPIFDTSLWEGNLIEYRNCFVDDFNENFTIKLIRKTLFIYFSNKELPEKFMGSDEIIFGINQFEQLTLIAIKNLNSTMIDILNSEYNLLTH